MRYIVHVLVCLLVTGCATATFKPWSGAEVYEGKGGALRNVGGIDVWEHGEPDRPYRIIGIIDCGVPITGGVWLAISLLTTDSQVISAAKEKGADGIILQRSDYTNMGQTSYGKPLGSVRQVAIAIKYVTNEPEKQDGQSSFAGNWAGTFKDLVNQQSGSLSVTVSKNNEVIGSIYNSTKGVSGSVFGTISNTGITSMTYTYPGVVYTATGIMRIDGAGHLVGNFNAYSGNTLFGTVIIDFIKQ
ncbi:MAG: hypothetical protein NTV99_11935 [Deltaproteobacteria bacterium]|nr:hypothetical protein [Deltaproteobacteria bacterium]